MRSGPVERVGVDPPGGGQVPLVQLVLPGALLGPDAVRQPIVVAVIADEGREKRIQLEQLLEIAIEQRGELRVGAGDRRCGWGRLRRGRSRGFSGTGGKQDGGSHDHGGTRHLDTRAGLIGRGV